MKVMDFSDKDVSFSDKDVHDRQCWSLGQFWSVLYYQSNFYRF